MRNPILILILAALPAVAQQSPDELAFIRKANQWMTSLEASKRRAAYTSWLQMGPDAMPKYRDALDKARDFHDKAIDTLCRGTRGRSNPYAEHQTLADQLDAERQRVIPLIRTDWKKEPKKIAMLREEMDALAELHTRVNRAGRAETKSFDAAINAHIDAMVEITREIERFEEESETADLSEADLRDQTVRNHIEAHHLEKLRKRFSKTREAVTSFEKAAEANKTAGPWAKGAMQTFAGILNGERAVLGLGPLRLEEKLSDAAEGHSKDMVRLGFFAHESPVKDKKTPWDRARLAGFKGNASGENIYMGSGNPQAAYNGWFGSDGHRFIMMASGPNVLGVGIAGNHWTMMTGRQ
ncbi:hypothetical protein HAHE_26330 [Haloferula helveola]|uniref:SCP domain-containing protein n=1 Tax=Haloferula helveola TaxID=490095 RepID=A0ABM7RND0_9BACT|nr:hypothetical protein HAHE_26330 [Haloferula helveola]